MTAILLVLLLVLSGPVNPNFMRADSVSSSHVNGSLKLYYQNNTQHRVLYDNSIQDCVMINLPFPFRRLKMVRIEVAHGRFVLYRGLNGRGRSWHVDSTSGLTENSAGEVGLSHVKSVKTGKASFSI